MSKPDANCPKCHEPINLIDQIKDLLEGFNGLTDEDEMLQPPVLCNLWCEHCKDMTSSWYWEENGESKEIEVPGLRDFTDGNDRVVINYPKGMNPES